MLILLHPFAPGHYDSQPGADHLDPQSHELHPGKRFECVSSSDAV